MTMQTPIQPTNPWTAPTSDAAPGQLAGPPPQAVKRGWPVWVWLLGALAVLLAAAVVVAGGEGTAVVNTHTAEPGEPWLMSVPGYAYEDLTGESLADFEEGVVPYYTFANEAAQSKSPELGDLYLGWSGHDVVAADGYIGHLVLAHMNQEHLDADVITEDDVMNGMVGDAVGAGATVTAETIGGEEVTYADFDEDHLYQWFQDGVLTTAAGPDAGAMRDFVEAYLETANQ